jgi:hypothetical protein
VEASHLKLASGDDDLFINETANNYNTAVELHPESFTYSEPKKSWKDWIKQKRRHLTTGKYYKKSIKSTLTIENLSREAMYGTAIILLIMGKLQGYALAILLIRTICFLTVFKLIMKRLKEQNLLLLSFFYDLLWPVIGAYLFLTNRMRKRPAKWK